MKHDPDFIYDQEGRETSALRVTYQSISDNNVLRYTPEVLYQFVKRVQTLGSTWRTADYDQLVAWGLWDHVKLALSAPYNGGAEAIEAVRASLRAVGWRLRPYNVE